MKGKYEWLMKDSVMSWAMNATHDEDGKIWWKVIMDANDA